MISAEEAERAVLRLLYRHRIENPANQDNTPLAVGAIASGAQLDEPAIMNALAVLGKEEPPLIEEVDGLSAGMFRITGTGVRVARNGLALEAAKGTGVRDDLSHCSKHIGTVREMFYGKEDHSILTCFVHCESPGWGQSFGGLILDERTGPAFIQEILAIFGVSDSEALRSQPCTLYRSAFTGRADALEGPCGIFAIDDFRRRMWPEIEVPDARSQRLASLRANKARAQQRIVELDAEIATLAGGTGGLR